MQDFTLAYLAEYLGAELVCGQNEADSKAVSDLVISRIATLESAQSGQISFFSE